MASAFCNSRADKRLCCLKVLTESAYKGDPMLGLRANLAACLRAALALSFGLVTTIEARDLSAFERQCVDIGFKKGTAAYGDCVLELDRRATRALRNESAAPAAPADVSRDGSPDDSTCIGYGFSPGTENYASCRMTLDMARRDYQQRQAAYQAEQARYEQQLAAVKAEAERRQRLRQAEYWVRVANAGANGGTLLGAMGQAGNEMMGISQPQPPARPSNTTVFSINGKHIVCNDLGGGFISCN